MDCTREAGRHVAPTAGNFRRRFPHTRLKPLTSSQLRRTRPTVPTGQLTAGAPEQSRGQWSSVPQRHDLKTSIAPVAAVVAIIMVDRIEQALEHLVDRLDHREIGLIGRLGLFE